MIPDHPNASAWLADAVSEFKWMLQNGVMADGQWHEPSTRYHGRVLAAFIPFAYALRQAGVMDAFNEIPELKRFVGYYRLIQTPPDRTMGGCALTPALSDANWETVWEATLGWAAGAYARTDPSYAAELWRAWERACAPIGLEPSPPDQLASLLWIGCVHPGECPEWLAEPFSPGAPSSSSSSSSSSSADLAAGRQSALLSDYAVLRQPSLSAEPYLIMSTTTQRQTEGHEHPDRGSFSLYHAGVPLVLDPGDGWCGYQWFAYPLESPAAGSKRGANTTVFDKQLQQGAWYRGSQSHSMVNFAPEGPTIRPENETWRPKGAFGHEWGLRGPAWVDSHFFTGPLAFVDLNVTRAVQASQQPGVRSYHRRLFANWHDGGSYLIWDAIEAPAVECASATYNLHVLTQLGWPGKVGCSEEDAAGDNPAAAGASVLECATTSDDVKLGVTITVPSRAAVSLSFLSTIATHGPCDKLSCHSKIMLCLRMVLPSSRAPPPRSSSLFLGCGCDHCWCVHAIMTVSRLDTNGSSSSSPNVLTE